MANTVTVVAVHPQKGQSAGDCQAMAQAGSGAKSFDEFGTACWDVYGKAVQINPVINSIKEGFMITNINFNTSAIPAVGTPSDLGGAGQSDGSTGGTLGDSGWHSDKAQGNIFT